MAADKTAIEAGIGEIYAQIESLRGRLRALRRQAAGEEIGDYTFADPGGQPVSLTDLFGDKQDLLVVHNMGKGCVYCTLWADGFNGVAAHLADRAAFVLVSPDPPEVQREFARSRGWTFRMASSRGTSFMRDTGYEAADGSRLPGVSAFHKDENGKITRVSTAPLGPFDEFCSVWHLFDLLHDGVNDWEPEYRYAG